MDDSAGTVVARRLELGGRVQGIGYRPVLARLARAHGLVGWVANTSAGIELHVQGSAERVSVFVLEVVDVCPTEGQVDWVQVDPVETLGYEDFCIRVTEGSGGVATPLPREVVTCAECRREMADPNDRRYGDVMISCSRCGPRFTLLTAMPYERPTTSMVDFDMCPECLREYRDPGSRRYHAQTTSCPRCGPQVSGWAAAVAALHRDEVVAIKGLGGFQWVVRVGSVVAIDRLRQLKRRPQKPLAIMVPDVESANRFGQIDMVAAQALSSVAGPIVVVPQRLRDGCTDDGLTPEWFERLAPGLDSIGLFLPTTGMHAALVAEVGPLVVSSGNWEGDPIGYLDEAAECQDAADAEDLRWGGSLAESSTQTVVGARPRTVLIHNRVIQRPVDDSVVQVVAGRVATWRLGRGLGPRPLELGEELSGYSGLAVGGQQKVALALSNSRQAVLGPHVGDMESLAARQRFNEQVNDLLALYGCQPQFVAHDCHPDYFTTRWAVEFAERRGIPAIGIQHHAAHVATGLLEMGWSDRDLLAITWDGSGYGDDGSVWGGEAFWYAPESIAACTRVARLRPFFLVGGDLAVRQPWRVAGSLLHALGERSEAAWRGVPRRAEIEGVLARRLNGVFTSSLGRLFDAVAVLVLGAQGDLPAEVAYEGQWAAWLEATADRNETRSYELPLIDRRREHGWLEWDWQPLLRQLLADRSAGVTAGRMAMRFHRGLARGIADLVRRVSARSVVLGGGVFQNRRLVEGLATECQAMGVSLGLPGDLPVNDGGLAAGQLWWATRQFSRGNPPQQPS